MISRAGTKEAGRAPKDAGQASNDAGQPTLLLSPKGTRSWPRVRSLDFDFQW